MDRAGKSKDWFKAGAARVAKVENNPLALAAKLELRENVLAEVAQAHVFDAFCGGGVGGAAMYRGVWAKAASWVGCDGRPWDPRIDPPRFVADNRRVLRCLDLQAFNVFDFDAFGSPWEQMLILAARRRWAPGELGAVVVTDGSNLQMRVGGIPRAIAQIVGMERLQGIPSISIAHDLQQMALRAWAPKAGVVPRRVWVAKGRHAAHNGKSGGADMLYMAMVFSGAEPPPAGSDA